MAGADRIDGVPRLWGVALHADRSNRRRQDPCQGDWLAHSNGWDVSHETGPVANRRPGPVARAAAGRAGGEVERSNEAWQEASLIRRAFGNSWRRLQGGSSTTWPWQAFASDHPGSRVMRIDFPWFCRCIPRKENPSSPTTIWVNSISFSIAVSAAVWSPRRVRERGVETGHGGTRAPATASAGQQARPHLHYRVTPRLYPFPANSHIPFQAAGNRVDFVLNNCTIVY
jgi:hypothetical protein